MSVLDRLKQGADSVGAVLGSIRDRITGAADTNMASQPSPLQRLQSIGQKIVGNVSSGMQGVARREAEQLQGIHRQRVARRDAANKQRQQDEADAEQTAKDLPFKALPFPFESNSEKEFDAKRNPQLQEAFGHVENLLQDQYIHHGISALDPVSWSIDLPGYEQYSRLRDNPTWQKIEKAVSGTFHLQNKKLSDLLMMPSVAVEAYFKEIPANAAAFTAMRRIGIGPAVEKVVNPKLDNSELGVLGSVMAHEIGHDYFENQLTDQGKTEFQDAFRKKLKQLDPYIDHGSTAEPPAPSSQLSKSDKALLEVANELNRRYPLDEDNPQEWFSFIAEKGPTFIRKNLPEFKRFYQQFYKNLD